MIDPICIRFWRPQALFRAKSHKLLACVKSSSAIWKLTRLVRIEDALVILLVSVVCWQISLPRSAIGAEVVTILGTGNAGHAGDNGPAIQAQTNEPFGVLIGPDGALYVCETKNHVIRRVDLRSGIVSTVVGCLKQGYSGDGGPATQAALNEPYEVRFDKQENMYFVERLNHTVRRVDAKTGIISTVAGTGVQGFSGDAGPATQAKFSQPHSIAFDDEDNLYICDIQNHRLRMVSARTGIVTTILGNGTKAKLPDGAALGPIPVSGPRALDFDGKKMWLALREGNAVYQLDLRDQSAKHIAGTGKSGYSGDGGSALMADLAGPKGIAIDGNGNAYIADTESHTLRKIDGRTGFISTLVGNGELGDGPDGNPSLCKMNRPHSLCIGPDGKIYIGDSSNHRVRCWIP